jgi:hypothetical protein
MRDTIICRLDSSWPSVGKTQDVLRSNQPHSKPYAYRRSATTYNGLLPRIDSNTVRPCFKSALVM